MMLSVSLTEEEARYLGMRGYLNMNKKFTSEYSEFYPWKNGLPDVLLRLFKFVNGVILGKGSGPTKTKLSYSLN